MTKKSITEELDIQQSIEGDSEDLQLLRKFLSAIKWESQWRDFTDCRFNQNRRFYYPNKQLKNLANVLSN